MKKKRVYNDRRWAATRKKVFGLMGKFCQNCGSRERLQIHHLIALSAGGEKFDLNNLTVLCFSCHNLATSFERRTGKRRRNELRKMIF